MAKETKISAEVVADSKDPRGNRLTSLLITFPRIILAEVNTHRMLSKNTSSSRAIPFMKMVESVQNDPFVPIAWQKEHKGMQGSEYWTDLSSIASIEKDWLKARDTAVQMAKSMTRGGVTKQLCNRLLEPFMWTTMLITGSKEGWDNFFNLRCPQYVSPVDIHFKHKSKKDVIAAHSNPINLEIFENFTDVEWLQINKGQAEIHIMDLAEKIYDAMNESTPKQLQKGEWHIPFQDKIDITIQDNDLISLYKNEIPIQVKISTAMAARTSYTTVGDEKDMDYEKMVDLHDRLIAQDPPHSSPLEHISQVMSDEEYYTFIKGKVVFGGIDEGYGIINHEYYPYIFEGQEPKHFVGEPGPNPNNKNRYGWCGPYRGFVSYRYLLEVEKVKL